MRVRFAVIFSYLLLSSGCLSVASKCRIVNETYNTTEIVFENIPKNVSERREGFEPYVIREYNDVPLDYYVIRGASVLKEQLKDGQNTWFEYGRLDQNVSGVVYITLKNNDSIGGFFRVEVEVSRENLSFMRSAGGYLSPNETKEFEFKFDLVREADWYYRLNVIPPKKKVEAQTVAYRYVNETRNVTVFEYVKKNVDVVKTREIRVCEGGKK